MNGNPAEEWQRLTEHYRGLYDEELREIAADFADLTETAKQVLRNEMRNRRLDDPEAPPKKADPIAPRPQLTPSGFESSVNPHAGAGGQRETEPDEEFDGPRDYTWKTLLCDCESQERALLLREALRRAGIDSWLRAQPSFATELTFAIEVAGPRVLVPADQLEQAIEIANQPIPKEIVEEFETEVPEFVPPQCPKCGAEDPVLENTEPTNAWLCEACGNQWSDPVPATQ